MYPTSNLVPRENFATEGETPNISTVPAASGNPIALKSVTPRPSPFSHTDSFENQLFSETPKPGTMAFHDAQKAHWKNQVQPEDSKKIQKLTLLRNIARDQEKAGLHFEGRRSLAEAEADLRNEQLSQTSQAARASNPLAWVGNSIKGVVDGFHAYFQPAPSITQQAAEFSKPIGAQQFTVRKSTSLSKRETAGEEITSFGVGLVDSDHSSIKIQEGMKSFLARHFKPERGDIYLVEAYGVFQKVNGEERIIKPSPEQHHNIFCSGVPVQFCRFLREPEKETAKLSAVSLERRDLVNRMFEFLMNSIPADKALEARQKLNKRNSATGNADTEFKVELMATYQYHCDPAKKERFGSRIDALTTATQKLNAAQTEAAYARDTTYFSQLAEALKELKPGARLYYQLGAAHFKRLDKELNNVDTFFINIVEREHKDEF